MDAPGAGPSTRPPMSPRFGDRCRPTYPSARSRTARSGIHRPASARRPRRRAWAMVRRAEGKRSGERRRADPMAKDVDGGHLSCVGAAEAAVACPGLDTCPEGPWPRALVACRGCRRGCLAAATVLSSRVRPSPGRARRRGASAPSSRARSSALMAGSKRRSSRQVAASSSVDAHTPVARPARKAAPSAVVSVTCGRSTGTSRMSAWNCSSASLTAAPPSTRSTASRPPASSAIAPSTSATW